MRVAKSRLAIVAQALLWCLVWVVVAEACPTCKNSSVGGENAGNLVAGYGWSIIFMMSMPFLILVSLGSYFYYEVCKAKRQQQQSPAFADPRLVTETVS